MNQEPYSGRKCIRQLNVCVIPLYIYFYQVTIASGIVILKDLSPGRIRQVTVLLVHSLKFTYVKLKGPNKQILT